MPNSARSILLIGMLVFPLVILAQGNLGSISGMVSDSDRAIVPNAPIQLKSLQTGTTYTATSSSTGNYTIEQVPAGTYDLFIVMPGYTTYRKPGVVIQGGQKARLDIQLAEQQLNTLGDGREFYKDIRGEHSVPSGPVPRTADGKPDFTGVWHPVRDADPNAEISALKPPALPWAVDVAKARTESNGKDSPGLHCLPGNVQLMSAVWLNKVIQTSTLVVIISEGNNPAFRQIFLDRGHPADLDPTWLGHSIAKWEGDTLVVDTFGFNEKAWIAPGNFPHTEKLRMITRIRRPDLGHLELEITYEDAGTFRASWKVKQVAELAPGEEIWEYICNENNQDAEHMVGK